MDEGMMTHRDGAAKLPRNKRRKAQPVHVERVSDLLLALALESAGGDPSKIRILNANSIMIENPVKRWTS
jgi:hypothetical protein